MIRALSPYRKIWIVSSHCIVIRVPTGTGKPGKMKQLLQVKGKPGNFEKMSKIQGMLNESGKSQGKLQFIN